MKNTSSPGTPWKRGSIQQSSGQYHIFVWKAKISHARPKTSEIAITLINILRYFHIKGKNRVHNTAIGKMIKMNNQPTYVVFIFVFLSVISKRNAYEKVNGGQGGTRTLKVLLPLDFESSASTSSATRP